MGLLRDLYRAFLKPETPTNFYENTLRAMPVGKLRLCDGVVVKRIHESFWMIGADPLSCAHASEAITYLTTQLKRAPPSPEPTPTGSRGWNSGAWEP